MTTTPALASTREELAGLLAGARRAGERIAFVPTMGALHDGHASLVRAARAATSGPVVVSIFVNPMQFAPTEDLDRYPRTLDADLEVCAAEGVDVVFAPSVEEMYPGGFSHDSVHDGVTVAPGTLATILDGASRPGHFDGVLTVVAKLFGLVRPDVAVFGQKDYQQLVLIRRMVRDLCMGIEVRRCRDGPRARRPGPLQPQPLPRRRPAGGRGRPQPGAARRAGAGGVRRTCRALGRDVGPQGRGRSRARLPRAHLHRPR